MDPPHLRLQYLNLEDVDEQERTMLEGIVYRQHHVFKLPWLTRACDEAEPDAQLESDDVAVIGEAIHVPQDGDDRDGPSTQQEWTQHPYESEEMGQESSMVGVEGAAMGHPIPRPLYSHPPGYIVMTPSYQPYMVTQNFQPAGYFTEPMESPAARPPAPRPLKKPSDKRLDPHHPPFMPSGLVPWHSVPMSYMYPTYQPMEYQQHPGYLHHDPHHFPPDPSHYQPAPVELPPKLDAHAAEFQTHEHLCYETAVTLKPPKKKLPEAAPAPIPDAEPLQVAPPPQSVPPPAAMPAAPQVTQIPMAAQVASLPAAGPPVTPMPLAPSPVAAPQVIPAPVVPQANCQTAPLPAVPPMPVASQVAPMPEVPQAAPLPAGPPMTPQAMPVPEPPRESIVSEKQAFVTTAPTVESLAPVTPSLTADASPRAHSDYPGLPLTTSSSASIPSPPQGGKMNWADRVRGQSASPFVSSAISVAASPFSDPASSKPLARVPPARRSEVNGPSTPTAAAPATPFRASTGSSNSEYRITDDPYTVRLGERLQGYKLDHRALNLTPRGLTNPNNYCYVNAILQALIACPSFFNLLRSLPVPQDAKQATRTPIMCAMMELVAQFSQLPSKVKRRDRSSVRDEVVDLHAGPSWEPRCVYKVLDKIRGDTGFSVDGRQEDAEEFLGGLLNGLHDEMFEVLKLVGEENVELTNGDAAAAIDADASDGWKIMGPKNKGAVTRRTVCGNTPISDMFRGQVCRRTMREGGDWSDVFEPFFTLQLDVEKANSVKEALDNLVNKGQVEGMTCAQTKKEIEAWQQMTLEDLPLTLILHLKCFDYTHSGCSKIIKTVDYSVDLKIESKLMSGNKSKYTAKQRGYKLVAVVYHDGKEATKGHYVTDVYHVGLGVWIRYDDGNVRCVREEQVFKPVAPRVPYLLMYRRSDTVSKV